MDPPRLDHSQAGESWSFASLDPPRLQPEVLPWSVPFALVLVKPQPRIPPAQAAAQGWRRAQGRAAGRVGGRTEGRPRSRGVGTGWGVTPPGAWSKQGMGLLFFPRPFCALLCPFVPFAPPFVPLLGFWASGLLGLWVVVSGLGFIFLSADFAHGPWDEVATALAVGAFG